MHHLWGTYASYGISNRGKEPFQSSSRRRVAPLVRETILLLSKFSHASGIDRKSRDLVLNLHNLCKVQVLHLNTYSVITSIKIDAMWLELNQRMTWINKWGFVDSLTMIACVYLFTCHHPTKSRHSIVIIYNPYNIICYNVKSYGFI